MTSRILSFVIFASVCAPLCLIAADAYQILPASIDKFSPDDFQYRSAGSDLYDFQNNMMASLQHEFPRLPGIFTSLHSCHLPDYGPLVVITVQPPALYLTRPVLQELEKRQRLAEQQAQVFRQQIDRASQIIKLKAREAELKAFKAQVDVMGTVRAGY